MAYQEFYMRASGGDDLNSGATSADVGGGSNSATYTSTGGNFDGTSVFTPTDGQTTSTKVSVGDYVSLYNTGDTVARCVAKVTTVAAGVNGAITIDTTIKYGTVPTSNSGSRACRNGGSWASLAIVASNAPLNTGTVPQSTRVNIKAGTYADTTTSRAFGANGSTTTPLWWRGYKTTPGDQETNNVAVAGTDIPLLTVTTGQYSSGGNAQKFSSIAFSGATVASNGLFNITTTNGQFYRCRFTNTAANFNGRACNLNVAVTMTACYFSATTTADRCIGIPNSGCDLIGCQINGGVIGTTLFGRAIYNTFWGQAGDAMVCVGNQFAAIGNSVYSPTGNGINILTAPSSPSIILNNYFSTVSQAAKAAINNTSGTNTSNLVCIANAYFNCTANLSGIAENFSIFDNGTLASEAFRDPSTQDFTILPVGQGIGFPGLFENTNVFRGYLDVGAVQHQGGAPLGQVIGNAARRASSY